MIAWESPTTKCLSTVKTAIQCPVCLDVLDDCVTSSTCGHSFCRKCIEQVEHVDGACPVCRQTLSGYVRNFAVNHVAQALHESGGVDDVRAEWRGNDGKCGQIMCDACFQLVPIRARYMRRTRYSHHTPVFAITTCTLCT